MRSKVWILATVASALAILLSACAKPTPAPTQPPAPQPTQPPAPQPTQPPAAEKVTIQVMVVDYIPDKTDKWLEEEVVPAFQKEHPNINVEFVYVNWGTLDETVQGYFAAGEGADILNLGSEYVAEYGDRLAPLGQYFKDWPDWAQFIPGTLDTVMWEGEPRGLPWLTAPRAYMCRTDILKEVGWDHVPTTFAEMVKLAGDATIVEGGALKRQGFTPLDDWQEYISLIWTLGGSIYKDDGSPNFDSPEAKAALQFMYDRRRAVLPNEQTAGLPETTGALLASDLVACQWGNLWGAPATSDPIWEKIELFPGFTHPDFPKSKPVVQVFNDWLAIPAYSKHIPEAVEFLKFLGSAENLNTYNSHFGSFPPRKDAWFGYVEKDTVMKKMGELMSQYGVGFADIRETAQFRDVLMAEMPLYFTDAQDLDTTLKNIQEKYTQILRDAGRLP
jgi:multiple sugar transport system substrate-binding protein